VETFEHCDVIVVPSGSCVGSIRHQHSMVARRLGGAGLARRAQAVAARTYELSELLTDVLGVEDVGAYYPHRVTYHPTCHSLRLLGVADRPVRLLRKVAGPIPRSYRRRGDLDQASLLAKFASRLTDYRASVRRVTAAQLAGEVSAALSRRGVRRVVIPADLDLPPLPAGVEVLTDETTPGADLPAHILGSLPSGPTELR
jgi:hypothetical protein